MLPSQSGESLLLSVLVNVGSNDECDKVEEGNPGLLGKELLGKGQAEWGGDPRDAHDGPETGLDCCADLVEGAGAGNDGHADEVD